MDVSRLGQAAFNLAAWPALAAAIVVLPAIAALGAGLVAMGRRRAHHQRIGGALLLLSLLLLGPAVQLTAATLRALSG